MSSPFEGKVAFTGLESSGKSLQLSIQADLSLKRNIRWIKKRAKAGLPYVQRTMAFDSPMSPQFIKQIEDGGCKYFKFSSLMDILYLQQADIFINEIIKYFPASGSQPLTNEQMDFLTQGAKSGVFLYFASQDFSQAHKQFRLLCNEVYVVTKIIGSRRPIESGPPVNKIWGLCTLRKVNPASFKGDSVSMESIGLPSFFFINKEDCDRFDTLFKVPLTELPPKIVRRQKILGYDVSGKLVHEKEVWI